MLHHIAQSTGVERNNGGFTQKRLDRDEAEPFICRWDDNRGRALVKGRKLRLSNLSVPTDTRREPELAGQCFERRATWSVADDVQSRGGFHFRHRVQQMLDALLRSQSADEKEALPITRVARAEQLRRDRHWRDRRSNS
jgi:hypothetical protein